MEIQEFNRFVGMNINDAKKEIPHPFFFFVVNENGRSIYRTYEYNSRRVCIWTSNDKITKIDSIN